MDLHMAKIIGAGLALIGLGGVGAGIGSIFASLISANARNPAMANQSRGTAFLGFALTEAVALYAIALALFIIYAA
jgi:F-type H+-transporting ATPase subunit c